jgi:hypothetical protein
LYDIDNLASAINYIFRECELQLDAIGDRLDV